MSERRVNAALTGNWHYDNAAAENRDAWFFANGRTISGYNFAIPFPVYGGLVVRKAFEHLLSLAASIFAVWILVNGDWPSQVQLSLAGIVTAVLFLVFRSGFVGYGSFRKERTQSPKLTAVLFRVAMYILIGLIIAVALVDFGLHEFLSKNVWLPLGILGFIAIGSIVALYSAVRSQEDK